MLTLSCEEISRLELLIKKELTFHSRVTIKTLKLAYKKGTFDIWAIET